MIFSDTPPSLVLHQTNEMSNVWDDAGTIISISFSIWRLNTAPGYYRIGDAINTARSKPISGGYLISGRLSDPLNDGTLAKPTSYHLAWKDSASGAYRDVTIWVPVCPQGYVRLGVTATSGRTPSEGSIYCVKVEFTVEGTPDDWEFLWNDYGNGGGYTISLHQAKTQSKKNVVKSFRTIGSVADRNGRPTGSPYYLATKYVDQN